MRVTSTKWVLPLGTTKDVSSNETECGDPAGSAEEMLNVPECGERFSIFSVSVFV